MTTCRELFTFSWPLRGRWGGRPKRSAWPLFSRFFLLLPLGKTTRCKESSFGRKEEESHRAYQMKKVRWFCYLNHLYFTGAAKMPIHSEIVSPRPPIEIGVIYQFLSSQMSISIQARNSNPTSLQLLIDGRNVFLIRQVLERYLLILVNCYDWQH